MPDPPARGVWATQVSRFIMLVLFKPAMDFQVTGYPVSWRAIVFMVGSRRGQCPMLGKEECVSVHVSGCICITASMASHVTHAPMKSITCCSALNSCVAN